MPNGIDQHSLKAAIVLSHFVITGVDTEKYQKYQTNDLLTDDQQWIQMLTPRCIHNFIINSILFYIQHDTITHIAIIQDVTFIVNAFYINSS